MPQKGLIFLGKYFSVDFKERLDDKVILEISANHCFNSFGMDYLDNYCIYTYQKKIKQRVFSLNLANDERSFEWAARNPLVHLPAPAPAH